MKLKLFTDDKNRIRRAVTDVRSKKRNFLITKRNVRSFVNWRKMQYNIFGIKADKRPMAKKTYVIFQKRFCFFGYAL